MPCLQCKIHNKSKKQQPTPDKAISVLFTGKFCICVCLTSDFLYEWCDCQIIWKIHIRKEQRKQPSPEPGSTQSKALSVMYQARKHQAHYLQCVCVRPLGCLKMHKTLLVRRKRKQIVEGASTKRCLLGVAF